MGQGCIVTMYPVHAVGDATHLLASGEDRESPYFQGTAREFRLEPWHDKLRAWAPDLWIDANPQREPCPPWLGHLLNDAVVCSGCTDSEILSYYNTGYSVSNCAMLPCGDAVPLMAVYTTLAVVRGEELLFSYGHDYWLSQVGKDVPLDSAAVAEARLAWNHKLVRMLAEMERKYERELRLLETIMGVSNAEQQDQRTTL